MRAGSLPELWSEKTIRSRRCPARTVELRTEKNLPMAPGSVRRAREPKKSSWVPHPCFLPPRVVRSLVQIPPLPPNLSNNKIHLKKCEDLIGCLNYESGRIPAGKWEGFPRSYTKWKSFIGRRKGQKKFLAKSGSFWEGHLPLGKVGSLSSSFTSTSRNSRWMGSRSHSGERMKLHLTLSLLSAGQTTPVWTCCFSFGQKIRPGL